MLEYVILLPSRIFFYLLIVVTALMKQLKKYSNYTFICRQIIVVLFMTLLATLLSFFIKFLDFTETNIVIIYIMSVLLASRYTRGFTYGIFASFAATLSFNFFFTEPVHTLTVYDKSYIFTFLVMLSAAIFSSTLTSHLITTKERANVQEKQAQTLYEITSSLAKTRGIKEVIAVSMRCLSNLFECDVIFIITGKDTEKLEKIKLQKNADEIINDELDPKQLNKFIAQYYSEPINVMDKWVCTICLPKEVTEINQENTFLMESVFMQITIAIEREYLNEEKETAKIETEQERFKSNLLRAVSHDLRTPLSVITGASEMLLHRLNERENIKVAEGIYEDSIWLTRFVENILNLTRIQEGRLKVVTQLEAVEEVIAEAIRHVEKYSPRHNISVTIPDDVLFVNMECKLIMQTLINLLDNAIKHSGPEDEINVSVTLDGDKVWFEVSDSGTGIKESHLDKIFDIFYLHDNHFRIMPRCTGNKTL